MNIQLLEVHLKKNEGYYTFGLSVLLIEGYALFELWKGRHTLWCYLLFMKIFEKDTTK